MKYLHRVFKAKKGTRVVVNISEPTRVLLISDYHYRQYKVHKTFSYLGGMVEGDSIELEVPSDGNWHVVIEKGGYFNPKPITASVEILPQVKA
ncbi:MAG: DUF1883 domain-containing protein [Bacteroidia bacterium]